MGLGGLILSPTRELALQIFDVVAAIGAHHDISALAVTGGGRDVAHERSRVGRVSLVVATPGRVLQHLEESPSFDASNALIFVVDEADRTVDLGFAPQLDAVVKCLPRQRQTLLFSATLAGSTSVLDKPNQLSPRLSRLRDLVNPKTVEFVVAATDHQALVQQKEEKTAAPTPGKLRQCYVVCKLEEKLDVVYSFIKSHLRCKCIVFVSACAQARYLYEALRGLQPGVPLLALHGKQQQKKRTAVYLDFASKKHAVLFATDVAARGLDFPKVDWIVQLDAPEDADAYVHRAGRAARGAEEGDALLVLLPSEEVRIVEILKKAKIPLTKLAVNPAKRTTRTCGPHVAALAASRPDVKDLAHRAFTAYVRSIVLAKDKLAFRFDALPLDAFATSLGLPARPAIKLPPSTASTDALRDANHQKKNINRKLQKLKDNIAKQKLLKKQQNTNATTTSEEQDQEEEPLFASVDAMAKKNTKNHKVPDVIIEEDDIRKKKPKLKIRDGVDVAAKATRIRFDDDGNPITERQPTLTVPDTVDPAVLKTKSDAVVARLQDHLLATDAQSRNDARTALRERKRTKKLKRKALEDEPSPPPDEGEPRRFQRKKKR